MLTIIVLLEKQYPDFPEFLNRLDWLFHQRGGPYELLVLANGTGNFFRSIIPELKGLNQPIRAFEFGTRTTQAVCLKAVLQESKGDMLLICGSYQQLTDNSMVELAGSMDDSTDIINPWRMRRVDPSFNQIQSRIFNWLVRSIIKTDVHDLSCTVKLVRRTVLEETELYGNMFRFLPVLAEARGFRIKEVPVKHQEERGRTGLYSFSDYVTRLIDIFTLFFNTRFTRKPLRFFGATGIGFLLIGIVTMFVLFVERLILGIQIGNRPALFLALLLTVLGVLVSSAGLLGEIIAFTNGRKKKEYTIEKMI